MDCEEDGKINGRHNWTVFLLPRRWLLLSQSVVSTSLVTVRLLPRVGDMLTWASRRHFQTGPRGCLLSSCDVRCRCHFCLHWAAGRPTPRPECSRPRPACARGCGHWRAGCALHLQDEPDKGGFLTAALALTLHLTQPLTSEKALYLFGSQSAPLWADVADHWLQAPHQGRQARRIHSSPRGDCGLISGDIVLEWKPWIREPRAPSCSSIACP